ncbi:UNVERIFIED_ORG: hypothetical protein DFS12_102906 [Chitinophaga ginsengisegetis]|nr:hypothetical protein [Chitinophaga ginsengisegetis]MDR6646341.1 hypothetical protein [Chitinophaga ginsengisegetis]MDR6652691.1 hypothetical protein [Chitinophaga ginsengisegetis]
MSKTVTSLIFKDGDRLEKQSPGFPNQSQHK